MKRVHEYINTWRGMGYPDDIPDEVPHELMQLGLAPSYKAICMAILKNDLHFTSLGFQCRISPWYGTLKRIELNARDANAPVQGLLF